MSNWETIMTKWDEKFKAGYGANGKPEPILIEAVSKIAPGHALDLACGLGRNSIYLANRGWQVTALDSSQVAVTSLPTQIDAHLVDIESPDFQIPADTYDLICDTLFLYRPVFPKIRKALKPGGLFVAVIPMADETPMNPAYLVEPGELQDLFSDWTILHYYEGKPNGDPARRRVAELVARK
jgi:tellurite methyltransferase